MSGKARTHQWCGYPSKPRAATGNARRIGQSLADADRSASPFKKIVVPTDGFVSEISL